MVPSCSGNDGGSDLARRDEQADDQQGDRERQDGDALAPLIVLDGEEESDEPREEGEEKDVPEYTTTIPRGEHGDHDTDEKEQEDPGDDGHPVPVPVSFLLNRALRWVRTDRARNGSSGMCESDNGCSIPIRRTGGTYRSQRLGRCFSNKHHWWPVHRFHDPIGYDGTGLQVIRSFHRPPVRSGGLACPCQVEVPAGPVLPFLQGTAANDIVRGGAPGEEHE